MSMITTRSVRQNRGALLKQIIEQGLDSSEEEVLKAASDSDDVWSEPSSSSSSASSSSRSSGTDSDFSEAEQEGRLSEATSESDVERDANRRRREEEAQEQRKKFGHHPKKPMEHRITLVRRASTIPHQQRMQEALDRATAASTSQDVSSFPNGGPNSTGERSLQVLLTSLNNRKRRRAAVRRDVAFLGGSHDAGRDHDNDYGDVIMWSSSRALLERYGSPMVLSFSSSTLPPMFSNHQSVGSERNQRK